MHVRLRSYSIDATTSGLQIFDQLNDSLTFVRRFHIIVVVIQFHIRIGFVGKLESILDEIFTQNAEEFTFSVRAVVLKCFIDNIPTFYSSFVMSYNGIDVLE